jgi:peptidoglycan hydrolase CwlO-like protein
MSDNSIDVYASFRQSGTTTQMYLWFDLGGAYLSSQQHPQRYPIGEKICYTFALQVSKLAVQDELKQQNKKLDQLAGQLKDLVKDKNGMDKDINGWLKDIENYRRKITEAEANIESTQNKITKTLEDQRGKQSEVDTQKDVVKQVERKLKDLE